MSDTVRESRGIRQQFFDGGAAGLAPYSVPLPAETTTIANVAASDANVTLKAANAARRGLWIYNDSDKTMYIKCGATASLTSYSIKVVADGYWEMPEPIYTGIVDGIWATGPTGNARITELS